MHPYLWGKHVFHVKAPINMEISDYMVVSSPHKPEMEALVKKAISEGWRPQGSVIYNDLLWAQAMVK
jgi:hypothetical protein